MASQFFIDKSFRKTLEKDIKKRAYIEEKIEQYKKQLEEHNQVIDEHMEKFYQKIDPDTVISTLQYYENRAITDKKKNLVKEINDRFKNSNLLIDDTLHLIDWYEQMCDDHNNEI